MENIRNIGIIAHIDAGKTTLSERILYYSGREHRMGEVHEGTTRMDWQQEEQERGITITSAATSFLWGGVRINLIDTPGHVDFTAEVERSLRVLDGAIGVFSGVEGVEAQSETVWRQADRYHVPRLVFVNKLDRVGSEYFRVLDEIRQKLHCLPLAITIPIGAESEFEGVIDLVRMKELRFEASSLGTKVIAAEVAAERREDALRRRAELVEQVAEHADEVMALFVDGKEIPAEPLLRAIRAGTLARRWVPAFAGAAFRNKGVQPVLDGVVHFLPSPADAGAVPAERVKDGTHVEVQPDEKQPLVALVFKVQVDSHGELSYVRIYSGKIERGSNCLNPRSGKKERIGNLYHMHSNLREAIAEAAAGDIAGVTGLRFSGTGDTLCDPSRPVLLERPRFPDTVISMAIEPRSAADRDRLLEQLERLTKEDPTLALEVSAESGQILMSGMGELHLEVVRNRLERDFKVEANIGTPRVAYRQTFEGSARRRARFERVIGGKEHLGSAEIAVRADPSARACTVEAEDMNGVPPNWRPKLEETARDCLNSGGSLGYPFVQVRLSVRVPDFAPQMTEVGLIMAVKEAFDLCEMDAEPALLEPVMRFQITTPDEYFGPITQDLTRRRATIDAVETLPAIRRVEGTVPLSEVFGYTTILRSISQGRAAMTLEPVGYAKAPEEIASKLRS